MQKPPPIKWVKYYLPVGALTKDEATASFCFLYFIYTPQLQSSEKTFVPEDYFHLTLSHVSVADQINFTVRKSKAEEIQKGIVR